MTFRKDKGFTLIELLITISLVGILGGLVAGMINYGGIRAKMRDNTRISDLRLIQNALEQYFVDYRRYPIQELWGPVPTGASPAGIGSHIDDIPTDPMPPRRYWYRSSNTGSFYLLIASMEVASTNIDHYCEDMNSELFNPAAPSEVPSDYIDNCYGVESPTVLRTH